jgi:hypothetical protein
MDQKKLPSKPPPLRLRSLFAMGLEFRSMSRAQPRRRSADLSHYRPLFRAVRGHPPVANLVSDCVSGTGFDGALRL